jgi:hypothetical protein
MLKTNIPTGKQEEDMTGTNMLEQAFMFVSIRESTGITITPTPIPPHPPFQSYRGAGGGWKGEGEKTDLLFTIMYLVLFISLQIAPRLHHILYTHGQNKELINFF